MEIAQLKEYILENNFIETILRDIGCHSIVHKNGMYQCANKDGDNKHAITVYENENLTTLNYNIPIYFCQVRYTIKSKRTAVRLQYEM